MDSKLSRWCDGLMEAGWITALIVTPLFFNIHSDRVFEPDKLTLLRSIAVVMLLAWLVKFVDQQWWQQKSRLGWRDSASIWRMPFVLPVTLLALIYLASTLFSVTPSVSWAGSYQRLQGTYTTLSYITIFAVTIMTMRTRAQVRRAVTAVIITSIPIAFYGLLQRVGHDPLPWAGDVQTRVAGHMGNAIFIAAYLIMAVPLTFARIVSSFSNILNDEELAAADVVRSSIYIFVLFMQLVTIYWSGSRGPWLGIGVGMFAFILMVLVSLRNAAAQQGRFSLKDVGKALLLVLGGTAVAYLLVSLLLGLITNSGRLPSIAGAMGSFLAFVAAVGVVVLIIFVMLAARRGWRWLWLSWILLSLLLGGWLIAFNLPSETTAPYADAPVLGGVVATLDAWRDLPTIGRFGRILEADSGTGRVRTLIWEGAVNLLLPHEPLQFPDGSQDRFNFLRPLIGYGPESMYVAYNGFYPPELATLEARNASPDRSHNETFDALVITGLAGFLVWQWLYLSVFYYGFRWLGVLRTRRDRNLLIFLWIAAGLAVATVFALWRGPAYIGVALPFGSIAGLVLYLIYYALFTRETDDDDAERMTRPFRWDRLLVTALIAAVLAHFVEIHFGIAIASTRLHFFLYLAILFVVTYLMPQAAEQPVATAVPTTPAKGKRKATAVPAPALSGHASWGVITFSLFIMAVVIGTLGYSFITFTQPPDMTSAEQLTTGLIFNQSLFINVNQEFADSPYLFILIILTWVLGTLLLVSEMVKDGEVQFLAASKTLEKSRQTAAAAIFGIMGAGAILYRLFVPLAADAGRTALLGMSLFWIWGALCLWAAFRLATAPNGSGNFTATATAVAGLVFTLPLLIAGGGVPGAVVGVICVVLLVLLWDNAWNKSLLPVALMAFGSLAMGMVYAYFQAGQLRFSLLYGLYVPAPQTAEELPTYLVREAAQSANFLLYYYLYVFSLMIASAFALSMSRRPAIRTAGAGVAYGVLAGAVALAMLLVYTTNVQVVQADMIYKRGRFYDNQASRTQSVQDWDSAIAIYEGALDRTPREDFYYLFLGRAYLERSTLTTDAAEQEALLQNAETRLLEAQDINPLNTDHTANLARLNTRWVSLSADAADQAQKEEAAEGYYQGALQLSPQNSVIRNEYARLAYTLKNDCDQALDIYNESIEIDPYYADTYFALTETTLACANVVEGEEQEALILQATEVLSQGLAVQPTNARGWLRLGQLYQQQAQYEQALAAYDQVRQYDTQQLAVADWNLDLLRAQVLLDSGDVAGAQALAERILTYAPAEAVPTVEALLREMDPNYQSPESVLPTTTVEQTTEFDLDGERPLASIPPAQRVNYFSEYPPIGIDQTKTYEAIISTEKGEMRLRLFPQQSPLAVNSFVFLAAQGYFDGVTFHRVLEDFMAQGGDPSGTGGGGPGYSFANEVDNGLSFDRRGLLAMANAGPDTNGSQFFITFVPTTQLNGGYTIFGELVEGDAVLDALTRRDPQTNPDFPGDVIERIDIVVVEE